MSILHTCQVLYIIAILGASLIWISMSILLYRIDKDPTGFGLFIKKDKGSKCLQAKGGPRACKKNIGLVRLKRKMRTIREFKNQRAKRQV